MKMNLLVSAVVLGLSSAALACPPAAGTFNCPGNQNNPPSTFTISFHAPNTYQVVTVQNGQTTNTTVIADGVTRTVTVNGTPEQQTYSCEGNQDVLFTATMTDPHAGPITETMRMGPDSQGNFVMSGSAVIGGSSIPFSQTCTHN